jgi:hypothetical protein
VNYRCRRSFRRRHHLLDYWLSQKDRRHYHQRYFESPHHHRHRRTKIPARQDRPHNELVQSRLLASRRLL